MNPSGGGARLVRGHDTGGRWLERPARGLRNAVHRASIALHVRELRLRARAWNAQDGSARFVIYGQGRSGSSLLRNLIQSSPEIYCAGELFSPRAHGRLLWPRGYLDAYAALSPKRVFGCKLKIYQMVAQPRIADSRSFLRGLHEDGWRFVYLVRRDLFRKSLSLVVTRYRNGKFIDRVGERRPRLEGITVDPMEVVDVMRSRSTYGQLEWEALGSIPHVKVTYEDDLQRAEDHQRTCDSIFDLLEVPSVPVQTTLVKTSGSRPSDYIQNYDEVIAVVRGSGFHVEES